MTKRREARSQSSEHSINGDSMRGNDRAHRCGKRNQSPPTVT